jgi:hypothetical protein
LSGEERVFSGFLVTAGGLEGRDAGGLLISLRGIHTTRILGLTWTQFPFTPSIDVVITPLQRYLVEIAPPLIRMVRLGLVDLLYPAGKPPEAPMADLIPDIEPHRPPPDGPFPRPAPSMMKSISALYILMVLDSNSYAKIGGFPEMSGIHGEETRIPGGTLFSAGGERRKRLERRGLRQKGKGEMTNGNKLVGSISFIGLISFIG